MYDRVNIATSIPSSVSFFAVPRGQTASLLTNANAVVSKTKTYRDTNMDSASVVPTKMFKFVGISIGFVHGTKSAVTNPADREIVLNGGYMQFRIVDKDLLFLPLLALPELNPQLAISTTANATTSIGVGSGGGTGIPMYKLPIPVTLNPYENFVLNFNFDSTASLTNTVDVYVVLHGSNGALIIVILYCNAENSVDILFKDNTEPSSIHSMNLEGVETMYCETNLQLV